MNEELAEAVIAALLSADRRDLAEQVNQQRDIPKPGSNVYLYTEISRYWVLAPSEEYVRAAIDSGWVDPRNTEDLESDIVLVGNIKDYKKEFLTDCPIVWSNKDVSNYDESYYTDTPEGEASGLSPYQEAGL